jgi:hypothetical protein
MFGNENRAAGGSANTVSEDLLERASDFASTGSENQESAGPDWSAVRVAYEAAEISVREIGRQHHVSDTAIAKKAKAEGWHRFLRQPANHDAPQSQTKPQTDSDVTNKSGDEVDDSSADDGEFKWDPDNEDVIVPGAPAIAIYLNRWNQIVIRQEGGCRRCGDDDKFVFVDRHHALNLIRRLELLLRLGDD